MKIAFNNRQVTLPSGTTVLMSRPIEEVVEINGSLIVRLDTAEVDNIYFVNPDGTIKWQIDSNDHKELLPGYYTALWTDNGKLKAFNFGCWDCSIDLETGKIIETKFTK